MRRQWAAVPAFIFFFSLNVLGLIGSPHGATRAVFGIVIGGLFAASLVWFGVLTNIVCAFVGHVPRDYLMTSDLSVWYSGPTIFSIAIVLSLAAFAFHTAVAEGPMFKAAFLDAD